MRGGERGGKVNCVPNVGHQATFTMQMVDDGLGDNILVLYDSVARRLGSPVVPKGPIPLTVVGGGDLP